MASVCTRFRRLIAASGFTLWFACPVVAQTLNLRDVLEASRRENTDIRALEAKLEALSARRAGATDLPAPMIGISYMGQDGPFRSHGMKESPSYEISQTIPFPTKIIASRDAASLALAAGKASSEYESRIILASVKAAFWDYFQAYNEKQLREGQLQVLRDHLKRIARSPVSDSLTNSHILGIQNEISAMESELDMSAFQISRARNVLAVYTGLSEEALARAPESLPLSKAPAQEPRQQVRNALLKKASADLEQSQAELSLARSSYLPDLTLTYKWNSSFGPVPANQEFMLGLSLPFVFFWQPAARSSEAKARVIESEAMQEKARRESEGTFSNLSEELAVLERKLMRLEKESVPRSEKRMNLSHSISFSDMQSLDQHREILEDLLKLKLERLRVRTEYEKKLAEFEILRGES